MLYGTVTGTKQTMDETDDVSARELMRAAEICLFRGPNALVRAFVLQRLPRWRQSAAQATSGTPGRRD